MRDVTRADVRDVIPGQPYLRHDPVPDQRVAEVPHVDVVEALGLEPNAPEVRARLGELVEQVLAEVRPGRLLVVGEGAREELAEAVEEVVLEPRRGDGEGRLGRGGVGLGQAKPERLRPGRTAVGPVGSGHLALVPEPPDLALVRGLARVRVALAPARRGLELVPLPSPHDRPGPESVAALRGVRGPVLRRGLVGVEQGAGRSGHFLGSGPVGRRLYRGGRYAAAVHGVLKILLVGRRVERGEVDVVHRRRFLLLARRVGRCGRVLLGGGGALAVRCRIFGLAVGRLRLERRLGGLSVFVGHAVVTAGAGWVNRYLRNHISSPARAGVPRYLLLQHEADVVLANFLGS